MVLIAEPYCKFVNEINSGFVCVEVWRPSQPNVERGQFSWPHFYWAGSVLEAVNQYCAHSFVRNWKRPFLNQRKGENDRRKYFMINLHERMLPPSRGRTRDLLVSSRTAHPTEPPRPAKKINSGTFTHLEMAKDLNWFNTTLWVDSADDKLMIVSYFS